MRKLFLGLFLFVSSMVISADILAQRIIKVSAVTGADMTKKIQSAIESARSMKAHESVVIELQNADYNISRDSSTKRLFFVSNTASESENPDQTKHIGLYFKNLKNITIDGKGARFVTHGEMTSFLIDECENITLKNFTLTAEDPTVAEMTVTEVGDNYLTAKVNSQSKYEIKNGKLMFVGYSWTLSSGIAQIYDPVKDITWRSWSPLESQKSAQELESGEVKLTFDKKPKASPGMVFQMRDAIRDEACGVISMSKNTVIENARFAFLGNFGIVGQASDKITYRGLIFDPEPNSGRTCAGFADFVQMSGCKGLLTIEGCKFSGAHDDPINIHGTHLKVVGYPKPNQILVRYMHHQTYGFQSFFAGNDIEFVQYKTLLPIASAKVKSAEMKDERDILITLEQDMPTSVVNHDEFVIENVTYTSEVLIRNNIFTRVSTRGILITTRRKSVIENNTFYRMQMNAIDICDDASGWYESGPVKDLTIRNNNFIECGQPVIIIRPSRPVNEGIVHKNIRIENNRFEMMESDGKNAVFADAVKGLCVVNNYIVAPKGTMSESLFNTKKCEDVVLKDNVIVEK